MKKFLFGKDLHSMSLPVVNLPNQEIIKKSKCEFDNQGFTTLPIIFSGGSVDYLNAEIRALDENYATSTN